MISYNENHPYTAEWLRDLVQRGLIPEGKVDARDIREVRASDVQHLTQWHTFAGIGGWPLALELAGWPASRPVWTGSCPCQPFSAASRRKPDPTKDSRHGLWAVWCALIKECMPAVIFGEQVAWPAGRKWLATVSANLETLGYQFAATDLCAAGSGAPHIRQRLFWGAFLADSPGRGWQGQRVQLQREWDGSYKASGRGKTDHSRADVWRGDGIKWALCGRTKTRPFESGTLPVAYGVPQRVDKIRGYGNAIVPQVAAQFIRAFVGACSDQEQVTHTAGVCR